MTRLLLALAAAVSLSCVPAAHADLRQFQTPSGNTGCAMDASFARCDVMEHSWTAPPKPASCELDWGSGVAVDKRGAAGYVCAGDTTLHQGKTLGYGSSVTEGRFTCKSLTSGVRCVNRHNKHGFKVSRNAVQVF